MRRGCQSGVNLEGTRQQIEENAISTLRLYSATGKPLCAPPCVPCGEWCVRFSLYLYLGPLSRFDSRSLVRAAAPDGAVVRWGTWLCSDKPICSDRPTPCKVCGSRAAARSTRGESRFSDGAWAMRGDGRRDSVESWQLLIAARARDLAPARCAPAARARRAVAGSGTALYPVIQ